MDDDGARATTERLKDRLRACCSTTEVNDVVRAIAAEVAVHEAIDPVGVIQIRNLAAWKRAGFDSGAGPVER